MTEKGLLVIFSGPSGAGKDSVLEKLKEITDEVKVSVSLTTRQKRENETDGESYYFVTRDYFEKKLGEGGFLEYAEYGGNLYGTPKAPVDEMLSQGKTVILKIEVKGAEKIRKLYPDCVSAFVLPPSVKELERRLRARKSEDEETVQRRLLIAREEIRRSTEYDYIVINDKLEEAASDLLSIIRAEKHKTSRNKNTISEVMNND